MNSSQSPAPRGRPNPSSRHRADGRGPSKRLSLATSMWLGVAVTGALALGHLARTHAAVLGAAPSTPPPADVEPGLGSAPSPAARPAAVRPRIDVVFALDTTGSMGGLLAGAKSKIWSIANQIASGQPRPEVRFGLVGYRDRGDAYVTRVTPLSPDMDGVHQALLGFRPEGGGDGPEDVNAALAAALAPNMGWGDGDNVLRLVFLVGDAPPHDDYDGPKSWELAEQARARGIVVNTLRCGNSSGTEEAWRRIASAAGGDFDSIAQDGGVIAAIDTPYDDELAELNRELAKTVIAYGSRADRAKSEGKMAARARLGAKHAASAAAYNAKVGRMNDEDLITQLEAGTVALDTLDEEALPEPLAKLPEAERKARLQATRDRRAEVNAKILELAAKRERFLAEKTKTAERKSELDDRMLGTLRKQAASIDVAYE